MGITYYNCRAPRSAQKAANPSHLPPSVNRLSAALSRLFAGLGFGLRHRRVCTTRPAFGALSQMDAKSCEHHDPTRGPVVPGCGAALSLCPGDLMLESAARA